MTKRTWEKICFSIEIAVAVLVLAIATAGVYGMMAIMTLLLGA